MATRKTALTEISNCVFTNDTSANEHTRAAVVALAEAAEANAKEISDIAKALQGSPINAPMIHIDAQRDE